VQVLLIPVQNIAEIIAGLYFALYSAAVFCTGMSTSWRLVFWFCGWALAFADLLASGSPRLTFPSFIKMKISKQITFYPEHF
jgi:hypothetical protein